MVIMFMNGRQQSRGGEKKYLIFIQHTDDMVWRRCRDYPVISLCWGELTSPETNNWSSYSECSTDLAPGEDRIPFLKTIHNPVCYSEMWS